MTPDKISTDAAKQLHSLPWISSELKSSLENDFPELRDSEDERIRKTLLRCCDDWDKGQFGCMKKEDVTSIRAYLERQKEQKSLNISAASEWLREYVRRYINSEYNEFHKCVEYDGSIDKERLINDFEEAMQKEQNPAEWSEEDELEHDYLCKLLRETWDKVDKGSCIDDAITWLENLPERIYPHSWEPSKEQMKALNEAVGDYRMEDTASCEKTADTLELLHHDLQKLL